MLPELGHFALILALILAALQAFFGIAGAHLQRDRWLAAVGPAVAGQFVMVATAIGCLVTAFVNFDFSVRYVAENSNSAPRSGELTKARSYCGSFCFHAGLSP
jgi:cytochrome c-type biogenesis protein CcmF